MVAWSFSVIDSFETCAWRHYQTKVVKQVVEQQTEQMLHGNRVHKALEKRLLTSSPMPADLAHLDGFAASVKRRAEGGRLFAEQQMALSEKFQPVSWFSKNPPVWVRAITDFMVTHGDKALVGDWKTGNPKPESAQLRLTAAVTFHTYPYINKITNTFVWLKTGEVTKEVFHRDGVPALWQEFMPRVQRLEEAHATDRWPKRPSGLCKKYCPVPSSKCEYRNT
jgi:hypothetical protein